MRRRHRGRGSITDDPLRFSLVFFFCSQFFVAAVVVAVFFATGRG